MLADEFSPDLEFAWTPTATSDPEAQERMLSSYTSRGILTLNEARAALGRAPLPDKPADAAMVLTAGGYVGLAGEGAVGKLAKRNDWDEAKHSRWAAGSSGQQGGRFAPVGAAAASPAQTVAADGPDHAEGGVCVVPKLDPPGDCTVEQHRDLQDRMENACGAAAACVGGESPEALQYKIARHYECLHARMRINDICFRGGDVKHRNAIAERYNAIKNCWSIGGGLPK